MTRWSPDPDSLRGRVAVVAGATRGAGRGIAAALGEAGATVIVNAGRLAVAVPSVTLITMLANVPAAVGVPWSRPVLGVNTSQEGRLVIKNVNGLLSASLAVGVNEYSVPT